MTTIWIVRKHPRHPYAHDVQYLEAFTIAATRPTKSAAQALATEKNKRAAYFHYSVAAVRLKD